MKNKTRQEILKELKFLLKEQEASAHKGFKLIAKEGGKVAIFSKRKIYYTCFIGDKEQSRSRIIPAGVLKCAKEEFRVEGEAKLGGCWEEEGVGTPSEKVDFFDRDMYADVGEMATILDGWVSSGNITEISDIVDKYENKTAVNDDNPSDIKVVPALTRFSTLYSREEVDEKLPDMIDKIGTNTLNQESQGILLKIKQKLGVGIGVKAENPSESSATAKPPSETAPGTAPAEDPYKQVVAGKFSFACRVPLAVGIYQQFLGVPADCKVGKKTIEAQVAKTKLNISLEEYFGNPPSAQQLANQKLFCDTIIKDVEKYKAAITKAGGTPIIKCPGAFAVKKGASTSQKKLAANTFEQNLQRIKAKKVAAIRSDDPDRANKIKEIEDWVTAQREAEASNITNPSRIEESKIYHSEKVKIEKANKLFERLMKGF